MKKSRKQIAFDLDTNLLKIYYPNQSWNQAYYDIKIHMLKNGFSWVQGSVYISNKKITNFRVANILEELAEKNPWLNICMRDCRESNIEKEHNVTHIFRNDVEVLTRVELNNRKKESVLNKLKTYKNDIEKTKNNITKKIDRDR